LYRTTALTFAATFLLATALISACCTGISWADSKWNIRGIDEYSAIVFEPGSIAVDSKNYPHIFYTDVGGFYPNRYAFDKFDVYTYYNGVTWSKYTFGLHTNTTGLAFALDPHDHPHEVCYGVDNEIGVLSYANWAENHWIFQTVDNVGSEGFMIASLAFDINGKPHIAYTVTPITWDTIQEQYTYPTPENASNNELRYAMLTESGWQFQTIDNNVDAYSKISIEVDSSKIAHLMYSKQHQIVYTASNSGWNKQVIVENATLGNMILDSHGNPHFIFISALWVSWDMVTGGNSSLMYSAWNGSAWNTRGVAANIEPNDGFGFLALDYQDQPHLDFVEGFGHLTYASLENGTWITQIVGELFGAGPLIMDSNGKPHISFGANYAYGRVFQMYATTEPTLNPNLPLIPDSTLDRTTLVGIGTAVVIVAIVVGSVIYFKTHSEKKKSPSPNSQ
jgi:hypothetical protein